MSMISTREPSLERSWKRRDSGNVRCTAGKATSPSFGDSSPIGSPDSDVGKSIVEGTSNGDRIPAVFACCLVKREDVLYGRCRHSFAAGVHEMSAGHIHGIGIEKLLHTPRMNNPAIDLLLSYPMRFIFLQVFQRLDGISGLPSRPLQDNAVIVGYPFLGSRKRAAAPRHKSMPNPRYTFTIPLA